MKEFRVVTTKDEYIDSLLIRREVFCFEQNVSYEDELDFVDKDRIIINGYENGQVVATGRINFKERGAKFERICVLKDFRSKSWGKDLMLYMINFCLDEKLGKIVDEFIVKGFMREDAIEFLKVALKDVDFGESCAFIISQKYNPLPKEKDDVGKMMASLMRYGYSINDIKAGLRIFTEGEKNGN